MIEPCARSWGSSKDSPYPSVRGGEGRREETQASGGLRRAFQLPLTPLRLHLPFHLCLDVSPCWSESINQDTKYVQSQGRDFVTEAFQAFRRPFCCHIEVSWKITYQFSKYFPSKTRKMEKKRERKKKETEQVPPTGRSWKYSFIQRNFLPINVSVHPDQNLQSLSS